LIWIPPSLRVKNVGKETMEEEQEQDEKQQIENMRRVTNAVLKDISSTKCYTPRFNRFLL